MNPSLNVLLSSPQYLLYVVSGNQLDLGMRKGLRGQLVVD